ncbi:hypothetical protein [Paraburkholderia fynbosensis]|uniref:Uncharacterized protein n=1 Tax=Paraburkholderia fynbosensis TaxID=1200993 RepID=A0A6J5GQU9_9BURK|nr:hypothetical protein [Paraburkholderia fynbosensis]CAB3802929.1 hypothetical protein LMG27177_05350 [Paraburkholderia fynbosensis]
MNKFSGIDLHSVIEATFNWYWLVDELMEDGYQVHLATQRQSGSTRA